MATYDSKVRLRQLNQPELSGYIIEVIGEIPNTGDLNNVFYPLNSNPNNFVTTGQTGDFITQIQLDNNYYQTLIYLSQNYYPLNNPSGYVFSSSPIVYATGNQNISGVKNFSNRPLVSGIPISLSGETYNSVLITGNQIVSGTKTFQRIDVKETAFFYDPFYSINALAFEYGNNFILSGTGGQKIEIYKGIITGFDNISAINILKSGYQVIASNQLSGGSGIKIEQINNSIKISVTGIQGGEVVYPENPNTVYTTGNQSISGNKNFDSTVQFNSIVYAANEALTIDTGSLSIYDSSSGQIFFDWQNGQKFNLTSLDGNAQIKYFQKIITGFENIHSKNITVSNLTVTGNPIGGQNLGDAFGVYKNSSNNTLNFRTIRAGTGMEIKISSDELILDFTGSINQQTIQNVIYTTGSQTISGYKTFESGANFKDKLLFSGNSIITGVENLGTGFNLFTGINNKNELKFRSLRAGSGIKISGDNQYINIEFTGGTFSTTADTKDVVFTTGNQTISGYKTFESGSEFKTKLLFSGNQVATGGQNLGNGNKVYLNTGSTTSLKFRTLTEGSGIKIIEDNDVLRISVTGIQGGEIIYPDNPNIVYITGNQNISGEKLFFNKVGIGSGSLRGILDVNGKIDYSLPYVTASDPSLYIVYGDGGYYVSDGYYFSFYVYGYKDVEGERIYSLPIQFYGTDNSLSDFYYLQAYWDMNSDYDGYYVLIDQDSPMGITNGYSSPSYGILLEGYTNNSFEIGKYNSQGYVTETSSLYQDVGTIGYPNLFSKIIESEFYLTTGLNNKLIINTKSVEINKNLLLSGYLINGEGNPTESIIIGSGAAKNALNQVSESNIIGKKAGYHTAYSSSNINYSNLIGSSAGINAEGINFANIIGYEAEKESTTFEYSNSIGFQAGRFSKNTLNSNFIGSAAGGSSSGNQYSNAIGYLADENSINSQFNNSIGYYAGGLAKNISKSNFIGYEAGYNSSGANNSIFIGYQAGKNNTVDNSSNKSSILIGNYTSTSGFSNSIAIGQAVSNSYERQLNIGNIIYASGIKTGISSSSNPVLGKVGILMERPEYTLDVSGDCRISGNLYISGSIFKNGAEYGGGGNSNLQDVVYTTGNQTISGIKTFANKIVLNETLSGKNILSEKEGYGAGIYTFKKGLNTNASGNIFGIFDTGFAAQIFDVMINSSYSVAKKYSIVHQSGSNPISYLNVNSGPLQGNDYETSFFQSGNSGVAMAVKNIGVSSGTFLVTLFLGASPNKVSVIEY
jgi:hypothetical protein